MYHVGNLTVEQFVYDRFTLAFACQITLTAANSLRTLVNERNLAQLFEADYSKLHRIVGIMSIVSNTVCRIDNLRLKQRMLACGPFVDSGRLAFEYFECEVEARKVLVSRFKLLDDHEPKLVVRKTALVSQALRQHIFSRVPKWRMTNVVDKC